MIFYTWCARLGGDDRAEVLALVGEAARSDRDAGFSVIEARDVESEPGHGETVWHLPIKARRELSAAANAPLVMVAYLRLSVNIHGQGAIEYTVHPDYRSRGISTLLVEELGLDVSSPGGWCGTGATSLRCWAYGSHPASERLTRRFGIEPVARLWTLLRHLTGPFAVPLEVPTLPGGVGLEGPLAFANPEAVSQVEDVLMRARLTQARYDQFSAEFADRRGEVLIASAAGRPIGFAWFDSELSDHMELRAGRVQALIVIPDVRGGGFGAVLLTRALAELMRRGAQLALLRIDPDDEGAVRMVRLLSFEQEDAHACYQIGDRADLPAFTRS